MDSFRRSAAELSSESARWLRADVRDVLRVEPKGASTAAPAPPELEGSPPSQTLLAGLDSWRMRLGRRRSLVLVRRRLLVALALGIALELIGILAGGGPGTRAAWLIAPALLAVGSLAAALHVGPRVPEVARLIDHDLALAERVSTALELESGPLDPGQVTANNLPAMVVAEGAAAVSHSLGDARASLKPAWAERGLLVGLAAALAVLAAVPVSGPGAAHGPAAAPRVAAATRGGARAAVGSTGKRSRGSTPRSATSPSGGGHRAPLRFGSSAAPGGAGRELAKGPSAGKPSGAPPPKQLAKGGSGEIAPKSSPAAGQSGASAGSGAGAGTPSAGGQAGHGTSASAGSHRTAASPGAGRAASGARAGAGAANAPGKAGGASSSSSSPGAFRAGHAPPGGESAGGARGSTVQPLHPPRSKPGTSGAGLPIQPGYTPSRSGSGTTGSGPPLAGGLGPARGASVGGVGGTGGAAFPYIAPSPVSATSLDDSLLLSYFAPFSPLLTWP